MLNSKPGVSEATRETVLTALDVLGYERPTKLRGERARLVGLVLPELSNPIFPALAEVMGYSQMKAQPPTSNSPDAIQIHRTQRMRRILHHGHASVATIPAIVLAPRDRS